MSLTIFKQKLQPNVGKHEIWCPEDTDILSVAVQDNAPTVWYRCGFGPMSCKFTILLAETGRPAPQRVLSKFLGTLLLDDGDYVLHAFVIWEKVDGKVKEEAD